MSKIYKCVQCGDLFEGTGKPGRPYQHCPTCRGLMPMQTEGGRVMMHLSKEPGIWAVLSIKGKRGVVEERLTHKQLLEHLQRVLTVLQERERRKEK